MVSTTFDSFCNKAIKQDIDKNKMFRELNDVPCDWEI